MKTLSIISSLVFISLVPWAAFSQEHKKLENPISQVDFKFIVIPTKKSIFEDYQLAFHQQIKPKTYLGGAFGIGLGQSKASYGPKTMTYHFSFGSKWSVIDLQGWQINTNAYAVYYGRQGKLSELTYRGGGTQLGLNVIRKIHNWGIGIDGQTFFTVGHLKYLDVFKPVDGIRFQWFLLKYGINISYNL